MGRVSVTILYSFSCLTTETVKYIIENSCIENLAASKYSMMAQRGKNIYINKQMYILHVQKKSCPVVQKCKRVCQ